MCHVLTAIDINECLTNKHDCQAPAICQNSIGSFTCQCPAGYKTDTRTTCQGKSYSLAVSEMFIFFHRQVYSLLPWSNQTGHPTLFYVLILIISFTINKFLVLISCRHPKLILEMLEKAVVIICYTCMDLASYIDLIIYIDLYLLIWRMKCDTTFFCWIFISLVYPSAHISCHYCIILKKNFILFCFQDLDECSLNTHNCIAPATCKNIPGSFECECPSGYNLNKNKQRCRGIY